MKRIIVLSLFFVLVLTGCGLTNKEDKPVILSPEEVQKVTEDFINATLMKPGSLATVKEITEEGNLYKIVVSVGSDQDVTSYVTKDGQKFFPQVFEMNKKDEDVQPTNSTSKPTSDVSNKQDVPSVELFVMSHCPYGTQIEKGILPVLDKLGDKIDFELKFVNYAMHAQKEIDEQLNQYCIQKNEEEKFIDYLTCFLGDGDGDACLVKNKINASQLQSCVATTDKEFDITKNYNDKSTWKGSFPPFNISDVENKKYGISGSPALVINGEKISASRDANSLLKTICSGFNNQPEECNDNLEQTTPAPGFGFDSNGSDTSATCN